MGFLRRQHRWQLGNSGHALGQRGSTARSITVAGDHGKQGLAHKADFAVAQNRIVMNDGAAVVDTGNIGSGDHVHHIRHGAHGFQRQRCELAMRHGRQAQSAMQRAPQLGQVIDIGCLARHMQVGGFMLAADAHTRALPVGLGFRAFVDAVSRVLAVVGKGLGDLLAAQFTWMVHIRLLAPRFEKSHAA